MLSVGIIFYARPNLIVPSIIVREEQRPQCASYSVNFVSSTFSLRKLRIPSLLFIPRYILSGDKCKKYSFISIFYFCILWEFRLQTKSNLATCLANSTFGQ